MLKELEVKNSELSDCEKIILGCIYEYHRREEKAPNLKNIMEMLESRYGIQWKMQTICTFFTRMEKKGLLTIKKNGRYSYYYPVVFYEMCVEQELKALCNIYFSGDLKQLKKFVRQL